MPTRPLAAPDLEPALRSRLLAIRPHLLGDVASGAKLSTPALIRELAIHCAQTLKNDDAWLLLAGLSASLPNADDVLELVGRFSVRGIEGAFLAVLEGSLPIMANSRFLLSTVEVLSGITVVDVNFSAQNGLNTGVQRVVRQTLMRWQIAHEHVPVVWSLNGQALRRLSDREMERTYAWNSTMRFELTKLADSEIKTVVIPWKSKVIVPEVALHKVIPAMSALAAYSGNDLSIVGHDAIPVLSSEDVLPQESERFAHFLSVVKFAQSVVCVSESAAKEFSGFTQTLSSQGLTGPKVQVVSLPAGRISKEQRVDTRLKRKRPDLPLVVNVGSQEPRKNQTSILVAADTLWRKGLEFELIFIGSGSPPLSTAFDLGVSSLQQQGRPVSVMRQASDSELAEAYDEATLSVFVSLHEGFGLPVAESLAHGAPVLTSNYGSVAEIALAGGCLTVNPRDTDEITAALESMLVDEAVRSRLHSEIAQRPARTWDDYAEELWLAFEGGAS